MYLKDTIVSSADDVHFKNYNVEQLMLNDMSFFRSDFISKFMDMNRKEFKVLSLTRVHFDNNMKDLTEFLKNANTTLGLSTCKSLTLETYGTLQFEKCPLLAGQGCKF